MAPPTSFTPATFTWLRRLARNNTRPWFEANRAVYETEVRGPMRALVEDMDARFGRFAPEIVGDARRSMFRIHRDTRFSRDKSPYKTNIACWFYHRDAGRQVGQDAEGGSAGFYLHIQPGECFLGGGIWMPPRGQLAKIRDALADDPAGFGRIVTGLRRKFGALDAEAMLTRLPRGYAPGHPAEAWLRYQSFTLGRALPDTAVLSPALPRTLERDFQALLPLVRWLNQALGYRPATRR